MPVEQWFALVVLAVAFVAMGWRLIWEWWTGHVRDPLTTPPGPPVWNVDTVALWHALRRERTDTGEELMRGDPAQKRD